MPLTCPQLGTWPTTQAFALAGNTTSDPLVHRSAPNPLSHKPGLNKQLLNSENREETNSQESRHTHITHPQSSIKYLDSANGV